MTPRVIGSAGTLRENIVRKRRQWLTCAAVKVLIAVVVLALWQAGIWFGASDLWFCLPVVAISFVSDLHSAWAAHSALRLYDSSPVAAYAAEIRHAFGAPR